MNNKVAIITASSTGIGKAIAQRLAKEGCKVIISSRDIKNVNQTVKKFQEIGLQAYGIVCHVGKRQDRTNLIKKTLQKYGRIDYLVSNAGIATQLGSILNAQQSQIKQMWDINYMSTFLLIQQCVPQLRKNKDSGIVIISSYSAYQLAQYVGHYALTKIALMALTKILAKQLQQDNIRVNAIAPGVIKTKFSSPLWQQDQKQAAKKRGLNRLGQPQDIANIVWFLLSNLSSYITGQCLGAVGRPLSRL